MARFLPHDRTVRRLVIAAIIVGLLGALVPPLFENRTRPLSTHEKFTVSTDPTDVLVTDVRDGKPDKQGPQKHHFESTRHTTTQKAGKDSVAHVDSETTSTIDDDTEFFHLTATADLNRESVYPVAGPSSSEKLSTPVGDIEHRDFEREGIQFFFPSETEQRSYPYYDSVAHTSEPADFTGTERINGVPTYTFRQTVEAYPLNDALPHPVRTSGPAKDFYSPAELKRFGFPPETTVVLEPYYSVTRNFWVEPTTGLIVNIDEDIDVLLATDAQEAASLGDDTLPDARSDARSHRALFSGQLTWAEQSRTAALERVAKTVNFVKALAVFGWLGKTSAVVLLAAAAWVFFRRNAHD